MGYARHGMSPEERKADHRKYECANQKRYREKHPNRKGACKKVLAAKQKGTIKQKACEICGAEHTAAHHENYKEPLRVRWLCHKHHKHLHLGRFCLLPWYWFDDGEIEPLRIEDHPEFVAWQKWYNGGQGSDLDLLDSVFTLKEALKELDERERYIVLARFGLLDGVEHTLTEIGQMLAVSRQNAQQAEAEAMSKLKTAMRRLTRSEAS